MKRREFLQQAGLALATLGISEGSLWQFGDRASSAIAKPATRKLALLVGIDRYPLSEALQLQGSVTDVQLQQELLIHRFGFSPRDVLTLTNEQATREGIESAFINHLVSQAGADDVVVFHFSGYGRSANIGSTPGEAQSTLVPIDGEVNGQINDLFASTLQLLLKSLKTDRILTVLDTSYLAIPQQKVGNLRVRSYPHPQTSLDGENGETIAIREPTPEVIASQNKLIETLKADPEQLRVQRRFGQLPGVVISAASPIQRQIEQGVQPTPSIVPGEQGFEAQWNGFSAGLLTYGLTQHLWLATPETRLQASLATLSNGIQQVAGDREQPRLMGKTTDNMKLLSEDEKGLSINWFKLQQEQGAEGAIDNIADDGKTLQVWLGGLPSEVLAEYQDHSLFAVESSVPSSVPTDESIDSINLIQLRSVEGLKGKAVYLNPARIPPEKLVQKGESIREWVRTLSHGIRLVVGICEDLERIERVDATSAFSGIANVSTVVLGESSQAVNCIFSQVDDSAIAQADSSSKPRSSYGLFSAGFNLMEETIGDQGEAVKTAVRRLSPIVDNLWAGKLLRLTDNQGSSRLAVRATLEMLSPEKQLLGRQEPARSPLPKTSDSKVPSALLTLSVGSHIGYRLHNQEERPLYVLMFGFDRSGMLKVFRPSNVTLSPKASTTTTPTPETSPESYFSEDDRQLVIPPGKSVVLPDAIAPVEWTVCCAEGLSETQIIFSVAPFTQTAEVLKLVNSSTGSRGISGTVKNPGETAKAVLEDLHQASSSEIAPEWVKPDSYLLSVNAWCSLRFMYRVV